MRIIAAVILLTVASAAQAQESSSLKRATAVYAAAGTLDVLSTAAFVLRGGHEGNPILSPLQDKPVVMLTVGVAGATGGVWAWNRYVGRKHPKIAAAGLYVAAGAHLYLAARNYHLHLQRAAGRDSWVKAPWIPEPTLSTTVFFAGHTVAWK
jgi:hypothetical protein